MKRISRAEALALLSCTPLGELMCRAHEVRSALYPGGEVTYVRDTNPNYTNVCITECKFCSFHRPPGHPEAYVLSPEDLAARVTSARRAGATTVLMQGGANPDIRLRDWIAYIRAVRVACPDVHIHPFSPAEICSMAVIEGVSTSVILGHLWDEGITTLPGGGAEILIDSVHGRIAPRKATPGDWLRVMEEAHRLGIRTTATMMYGHVETNENVVDHLLSLRKLQDRTGGFSSFVPWSFKPGGSALTADIPEPTHPARYVRIIAVARVLLDNVPHVQSSWFSESVKAGQLGLLAGADDFGGILIEENVLRSTGHERRTTEGEVTRMIRDSGFIPVRRDSYYRVLDRGDQAACLPDEGSGLDSRQPCDTGQTQK